MKLNKEYMRIAYLNVLKLMEQVDAQHIDEVAALSKSKKNEEAWRETESATWDKALCLEKENKLHFGFALTYVLLLNHPECIETARWNTKEREKDYGDKKYPDFTLGKQSPMIGIVTSAQATQIARGGK